ncbi:MAG: YihY/virulence factor BrkB family protein, partial [Clostridia bacterium]|nr:YihY/virulence factor BrkB family protein [Clostridia bacterium]
MREFPQGGLLGKLQSLQRRVAALRIPLYAANASFFLVLSVFPALLLLVSILQHTSLEVERLGELLQGILPQPFLEGAEELILTTYDTASYTLVGISAVTALWSASRGIYGLLTGLNGIYGVAESRSWLHKRLLSVGYTFAFLLVVLLTLGLHVFSTGVLELLSVAPSSFGRFLADVVNVRYVLLVLLQTGVFAAMFMALPNRRSSFRQALPGAVLACGGWLAFSRVYEIYLAHFSSGRSVYGSVYAVTLAMLWLYCCICIVFYGGGLNVLLMRHREQG